MIIDGLTKLSCMIVSKILEGNIDRHMFDMNLDKRKDMVNAHQYHYNCIIARSSIHVNHLRNVVYEGRISTYVGMEKLLIQGT
jgi:hypothetical protein